jgi:C_GCAxxG_C_C family probable redox protein
VNKAAQRSGELFSSGYYCAESVLLAIAEEVEIQSHLIPRIATGFCSGMARTCGVCGAVSGAILGISLVTGRDAPDESVEETYALVRELIKTFEDRFGSTNCQALTGCDLGTEEGQTTFTENNLIEKCREYVEEATRIASSLIENREAQSLA